MNVSDIFSSERERFATFVVNLVSRDTATFYRGKKAYPIDKDCIRLISLYSYVFFDATHGAKPSIPELGLFLQKGDDVASLYQDACYWFERWNKAEEDERCRSFCEELNSLILSKAKAMCRDPWILLPDFRARREDFRRKARYSKDESVSQNDEYFSPAIT